MERKWKTYFISFLAYSSLHCMRMTYSHSKPDFQSAFGISNIYLGVFDALIFISLAFGFFFRYYLQKNLDILQSYAVFMTITTMAYLIVPITSLVLGKSVQQYQIVRKIVPGVGLSLFGLLQFAAWPTLFTLVSEYFDLKKEGKATGAWSACADMGNIIGFGISGIIVESLSFRWEVAMLVASCFSLIMVYMVFFMLEENNHKQKELPDNKMIQEEQSNQYEQMDAHEYEGETKSQQFFTFCQKIMMSKQNRLYIFSIGLLKSIYYGFLLWLPTYLSHQGLKDQKSIISIILSLGTLAGSYLLGHCYEQDQEEVHSVWEHIKHYSMFYCCVGLTILIFLFYILPVNATLYFLLSALIGALLGGCFNMMVSNEVISITKGKKEDVDMLSTLSMAIGNVLVGFVQLVIGVLFIKKNDAAGQKKIFIILLVVAVSNIAVLFWRSRILGEKKMLGIEK